jgi:hypothetical protein
MSENEDLEIPAENAALKALRSETILFEGQILPCVLADDLNIYIPIAPVCDILGIGATPQAQHIRRHRSLRKGLALFEFEVRHGETATRRQKLNAISLTRFHTWLSHIAVDELKNEAARSSLEKMQDNLADVIYAYFGRPVMPKDVLAEKEGSLAPDLRTFYEGIEQARQARQLAESAIDRLAALEDRLDGLEVRIAPRLEEFITPDQQRQFIRIVNILGDLLKKKNKGDIPTVHNGLKDQFGFTSYKLIPAGNFPAILQFCAQWYARLTPPGTPLPEEFSRETQKRLL